MAAADDTSADMTQEVGATGYCVGQDTVKNWRKLHLNSKHSKFQLRLDLFSENCKMRTCTGVPQSGSACGRVFWSGLCLSMILKVLHHCGHELPICVICLWCNYLWSWYWHVLTGWTGEPGKVSRGQGTTMCWVHLGASGSSGCWLLPFLPLLGAWPCGLWLVPRLPRPERLPLVRWGRYLERSVTSQRFGHELNSSFQRF
jgi:hypothetical protein